MIKSASVFGDPGFPLVLHRHSRHGSSTALHRHEFHELVIITNGRGRHQTGEGDYPIEAGDVFLLRGDMKHGYADADRVGLVNILFAPRRLQLPLSDLSDVPGYHVLFRVEPRLRRQDGFRGRLRLRPEQLVEANGIVAALEKELVEGDPGYRFPARAHLMNLIAFLSRSYTSSGSSGSRPLFGLGDVLAFMEGHYAEDITVTRLVQIAHMSRSTLMRTFRRVVGRSPIDYLLHMRIGKALEMLRDRERSITDVAFTCGFHDSNYFTRQFRLSTGHSPREYRRSLSGSSR